jgi:chromosome segregation ATPase
MKEEQSLFGQVTLDYGEIYNAKLMSEYGQYAAELMAKTLTEQIKEMQTKYEEQQKEWKDIQDKMDAMEKLEAKKTMPQPSS